MVNVRDPKAIAWANGSAQGIKTKGGKLVNFPGEMPTQTQVDEWEAEYSALSNKDEKITELLEVFKVILNNGIKWRKLPAHDWFDIKMDDGMANFLSRVYQQLQAGVTNPHNGKLFSGGNSVDIDDTGMEELCEFSAAWGHAVSFVHQSTKAGLEDGSIDPTTFDPSLVDWSITWPAPKIAIGWSNNTVTQKP